MIVPLSLGPPLKVIQTSVTYHMIYNVVVSLLFNIMRCYQSDLKLHNHEGHSPLIRDYGQLYYFIEQCFLLCSAQCGVIILK